MAAWDRVSGTVEEIVPCSETPEPWDKSGLKPAGAGLIGSGRAAALQRRGPPGSVPSQRATQKSDALAAALTPEGAVGARSYRARRRKSRRDLGICRSRVKSCPFRLDHRADAGTEEACILLSIWGGGIRSTSPGAHSSKVRYLDFYVKSPGF